MHTIHKVLVCASDPEDAKAYAEYLVEEYAIPQACDYYTILDVVRASDGVEEFIFEIEKAKRAIVKEAQEILGKKKTFLWKLLNGYELQEEDHLDIYELAKALRLLDGEWLFESKFYSGEDFSTLVSESTLVSIRNEPEKFWLVSFDFHF